MNQRLCCLIVLFLSVVPLLAAGDRQGALVGGWKPIEDPKEKHVMEIGQFAVTEYNKRSKSALKFESVEKGETQVVSGTNYRLILVVKDGPSTKKFEAVVWEKPREHFKSLTSFKPFKPMVGGWKPIEDLKEKHVMEIGQFAVTEYNKRSKSTLKFESVEKGETQVVSGTNYRLILVVKDGPSTKKFEAVVWEKPWEHFKSLTSFKPFKPMVGGWKPIEDPKEKHVMEIGQFAVTEYNKRSKSALKFKSVEKGETQVVSGTNYRLILVVKDGPSTKKFEAVVLEKPWEHFKSLTSFKPMPMLGGWKPIEDPKEKHVMEIGQFAVTEYNKQSKSALKFESVEKGETQVVSGTNYRLILVVKDGPSTKKFEAVVWEKPWEHFKSLTSFKPFKPMVGGWKPIEDPKEKHVMEIGQFAVTEYNKRSKSALNFESVEKGETQVVSGTNYRLILVVKDGPLTKKFEAVVWEKPWEHFKSLTSFKPFKPMVGGWKPIEDPKEKHVMEIGQFAVTEYNKRSKSALNFESVEKGETQVVSGTNYRLILVVKDGPSTKKFEAVVWEKPWEHFKSLTSFKPFKPMVGGWKPIEDLKEKHVMEIGQFAVTEYNKRSKSTLKFESVEKGETQVVSGTNYRLILVVKDGPSTKKFEAVVWEKPWEHFKSLTSFKPFKPMVGGWKPIEDPKEKHVMEIGQFVVTEYNKRSKSALKFGSVEKGETQVVSGTNYRLILVVKDGPSTKKFEAVVWEKPWEHFKSLTSFKPFKPMVGGWKPIEDPKEKHVMEIGQFAVTEYNKRSKSALKFESVEKGETQVVSGTNYRLILVVKDRPSTKKFEAVVLEKPWEHFKSLTSFKPMPMLGGWKPIEDPKEKHVMEIGQFAVTEYNKRSKSALKFESVEKGETQVVSGTNYRLILVVKDGPSTKKFEAVVLEKPWEHFKSLTSFKPMPMLGGWKPIEDPKEKHVMEIGQFAVTEYNKRSKGALKFESVEKGETQVVSGTNYRLILVVKDGPSTKKFEAVVWEKPWEHFKSLTSFKPMVK